MRIVDPNTRVRQSDRAVGEIWIKGPSIASGYWRRVENAGAEFLAIEASGESGFLRTGDLGLVADGELFVVGRIKDVVISNGRKISLHDIERSVEQTGCVRTGHVAAVRHPEREEIAIIVQTQNEPRQQAYHLCQMIVRHVAKEHEIVPSRILLVPYGTLARTTSGKFKRSMMGRLLFAGALCAFHEFDSLAADLRR
jgi:acyl-CoA synthetase (AMP-forming)/AMP-acid ligase II